MTLYSEYYKTVSNILTIRMVTAEHLIAMKLMSGRRYKYDLSDIVGILQAHQKNGNPIGMEQIEVAVCNLYGNTDTLPHDSILFIRAVMDNGDYEALYQQYRQEEQASKNELLDFDVKYPGITTDGNINDILETLKKRKTQNDLL